MVPKETPLSFVCVLVAQLCSPHVFVVVIVLVLTLQTDRRGHNGQKTIKTVFIIA